MNEWQIDTIKIVVAAFLVLLNGFFVAAEFALVKVRGGRLDALVRAGKPFAKTASWLSERMDASLATCQLGITMASLGLGWIAEPAFASRLRHAFHSLGIQSEFALHTVAFISAFTAITAIHLVIGEQAPKIFSLRRPEATMIWCAVPLKGFYLISYPLMMLLNLSTAFLLRLVGIQGTADHEPAHTEDEIRELVHDAHAQGELTRSEKSLIHAVFEFDDTICRRVMVPRSDVVYFDVGQPVVEFIEIAQRTKHTRYPLCEGSLDRIVGIVHIKDLVGVTDPSTVDLDAISRPPKRVPETMPVSRLLRHFQSTHQLMAVVIDEHGTVVGIVTLENVLEAIVGPVEDEFDTEPQSIVPETGGQYLVRGATPIHELNRRLNLELNAEDVDTFSGLLTERLADIPQPGHKIELNGATAEVLEVKGSRATLVRVTINEPEAQTADDD